MTWNPSYWEDLIAIRVIEQDEDLGDGDTGTSLSVKVNRKDNLNAQLNTDVAGQLTFSFEEHSEDCGTAYYNYFDNTSFELSSGFNYGLKLKLDISN